MNDFKLLSAFMTTETKIELINWSSKRQSNKTDTQKYINLLDKIFYYIYIALY